jgi:two-component system, OmpR family, response regulator PfeR
MCADSLRSDPETDPPTTVLVMDDDPAVVEIVEIALRLAGMRVLGTSDSHEGVRLAASEPWDIALLDVDMPGLSGWVALDSLKAHCGQPVVMMSALATAAEASHRGADAFLGKPFSMTELVETIRRYTAQG